MQTTKQPYEFLVRWDRDGKICGAHVQWRYVVTEDDGTFVTDKESPVEPVGLTVGARGYPLADILTQTQIDTLATLNSHATDLVAAARDRDAAQAEAASLAQRLAAAEAERDAAVQAARKELDA